ncbi:hypothetical protein DRE_03231 [Drechslerella stenobrocha 248]|uniref:Uncharacterized protein n=1 Tax=Drechslerella stenobrocha 248 TaxID=1043628 RepID=W7HTX6_9PEZI|nr:hypothetical protein DRE_03231 [Drechslerella stenobrocha 248]
MESLSLFPQGRSSRRMTERASRDNGVAPQNPAEQQGVHKSDSFVNLDHSLACNFAANHPMAPNIEMMIDTEIAEMSKLTITPTTASSSTGSKTQKSSKPPKASKSTIYHHVPTFAAQSFTLTATPEVYNKNQTHRLSRLALDKTRSRRAKATATIEPLEEDRSSGEYERSAASFRAPTPTESGKKSSRLSSHRFVAPSPHYVLFSSSILNQEVPGVVGNTPSITPDSYTRGRPDWSEMDETIIRQRGLKRVNSILSTKSIRSRRHSKTLYPELGSIVETDAPALEASRDAGSIYKGRGCVPWRLHVKVM